MSIGLHRVFSPASPGPRVFVYPLFVITDHGAWVGILICQLIFAVFVAGLEGSIAATMVEMFPLKTRCSGIAIGYNLSVAIFGGLTPMISTWLIKKTDHNLAAPAYYLMAVALVGFVAAVLLRKTPAAEPRI